MDTDAEETASAVARDEDEDEKESSCPVSEDRREQERRSTVCRELQRRSSGRLCSVTFTHPETQDRKWSSLARPRYASYATLAALTCQVQVDQRLSEGGDGGGEGVDRLVRDAATLTQVQPGQVRDEAHQQARRHVRQVQAGQSQLCHVLEPPSSGLPVSWPIRAQRRGQTSEQRSKVSSSA